jgi:hypothetical protein
MYVCNVHVHVWLPRLTSELRRETRREAKIAQNAKKREDLARNQSKKLKA